MSESIVGFCYGYGRFCWRVGVRQFLLQSLKSCTEPQIKNVSCFCGFQYEKGVVLELKFSKGVIKISKATQSCSNFGCYAAFVESAKGLGGPPTRVTRALSVFCSCRVGALVSRVSCIIAYARPHDVVRIKSVNAYGGISRMFCKMTRRVICYRIAGVLGHFTTIQTSTNKRVPVGVECNTAEAHEYYLT